MKVLVADKFEQSGIDGLKAAGCEVVYQPDLKDDALTQALKDTSADVLVVRSTAVTGPMLESGSLSLVVRAGAGYNTIDVATASKRGIYVSNCPGKNAVAVAELAFALLLSLDRRVPDNVADLRAGTWNKKEYSKARGLYGRTLGLLGYGNIGQEMARRAHAFGMPIVVWSRRFATGKDRIGDQPVPMQLAQSPGEVAERSDVLSVHLALNAETKGLVNASVLERLKPGSYFVNTARGEVVDHAALEQVVRERGIRVGLDVFANEPPGATGAFSDPLVALPNVYGTHHIGASTDQAQEAIAAETVRIIASYRDTGKVPNVVNLAKKTPATHMLVVRHRDRPGVLAHVFEHLRHGNINVQETENVIFEGAQAAVARINLDGAPSDTLLTAMQGGNPDILDLHLVTI
jgi:D-3-phosphoglycerate dehydrogenase / 2-oxoglutarate reductase